MTEGLLSRVVVDEQGCWRWQGVIAPNGYGAFRIRIDSRRVYKRAHRVAYETFVGPIPAGLVLDHLCRVLDCVNPEHLEPVTVGENTRRGVGFAAVNARKRSCVAGHAFDAANTYLDPGGGRHCRICRRVASDKYVMKKRARCAA